MHYNYKGPFINRVDNSSKGNLDCEKVKMSQCYFICNKVVNEGEGDQISIKSCQISL